MVVTATRSKHLGRPPWITLATLVAITLASPAAADPTTVSGVADPALAWLTPGVPVPGAGWRHVAADGMANALCGGDTPVRALVAVTTRPPAAMRDCRPMRGLRHATLRVGRQVGVLVTARGAPSLTLDAPTLYRAVAAGDGGLRTWRAADGRLPDTPIAVLLPDAAGPTWSLLSALVLQSGCLAEPAIRRIFDAAERKARCEAVRADGVVDRRRDGADVGGWLATRGAGAVAFVSYPEFLALGDAVEPVAFDGALPTFSAIAADRYAVARTVHLTIALPSPADPELLRRLLRVVGEETIGPGGTLAGLGIVPLPAAQRVEAREALLSLGGAI